jgi:hypothetical protein
VERGEALHGKDLVPAQRRERVVPGEVPEEK